MLDKSKNVINVEQVDVDDSRVAVSKKEERYYLQFTNCVYKVRSNWQTSMLCFFVVYKLDDYPIVDKKKEAKFFLVTLVVYTARLIMKSITQFPF